ncbi:integrase arm-type DNA-binding domain-containing protein [Pseudomonas syringae]|uniref:integrase arm-type DNA-binding domain-containing protein n=1 Tax=Pseudomonas syringae TaxID=317 RepID=UPI0031FEEA1E
MSLDTYPKIGLRDVRELRDQARVLVARGIDPRSEHRQAQRPSKTPLKLLPSAGMRSARHA